MGIKIVAFSDTHHKHKEFSVPKADLLLYAGDCSDHGSLEQVTDFLKWLARQKCECKIMIAGNHDFGIEVEPDIFEALCKQYGIIYLNDSGYEYRGIKIWGSPVTPEFHNWAFNRSVNELDTRYPYIKDHWDKIPNDTEILMTHGPALGVLDRTMHGDYTGCLLLDKKINQLYNLRMHIFGHIHEAAGWVKHPMGRYSLNASALDGYYNVKNRYLQYFEWDSVFNDTFELI
jgi:Icc-related predicted phosphoesterase